MILVHRPSPPLDRYIDCLWHAEGHPLSHARERVLPDGRFQIIIDLTDGFERETGFQPAIPPLLVGVRSQCVIIETAGLKCIMGATFQAGGTHGLLGFGADEFHNQIYGLDSLWGRRVADLRDRLREAETPAERFRLLECALQQRIEPRREIHAAVQFGLHQFIRAPHMNQVIAVTKDAGISRRRFSQLFREQIGMTPKFYCRLLRFHSVIRQIGWGQPVDWADVALAGGYCDQSHMANEFRDFAGMAPTDYLNGPKPYGRHIPIA